MKCYPVISGSSKRVKCLPFSPKKLTKRQTFYMSRRSKYGDSFQSHDNKDPLLVNQPGFNGSCQSRL